MNKIALSALVAAGMAVPAMAQTYTYETRLIMDGEAGAPNVAGTQSLPYAATATAIGFWLQARVTATGTTTNSRNFGIGRFTSPAGTPSMISLNDPGSAASTLNRGQVSADAGGGFAIFGRGEGFRSGGIDDFTADNFHSAAQNGTGASAFPSSSGNEHGNVDAANDRIFGFDAYVGPSRTSTLPQIADGTTSQWYNLYRFVLINGDPQGALRNATVTASGQLSTIIRIQNVGGGTFLVQLGGNQTVTATRSDIVLGVVPTPAAAAMLGLGGLVAGRRRR